MPFPNRRKKHERQGEMARSFVRKLRTEAEMRIKSSVFEKPVVERLSAENRLLEEIQRDLHDMALEIEAFLAIKTEEEKSG